MSDSDDSKTRSIPSWQRLEATASQPTKPQPAQEGDKLAAPDDRTSLTETAAKFLEDEEIRDSPRERKESFLALKGLNDDEIRNLLNERERVEAENTESVEKEQQETSQIEQPTFGTESTNAKPTPSKDISPIITYPEFLLHSQKPPPLFTLQRLLNTFYFATGAAATLYGTSKYVVEPMVESMTSARHSLFERASADIEKLNERLTKTVSKLPDISPDLDNESDAESMTSDGTRFFNRSAATQTSPSLSRSVSEVFESPESNPSICEVHHTKLSTMKSKLSELLPENESAAYPGKDPSNAAISLKDTVEDLRRYLDGLASANIGGSGKKPGEMDEVAKVKAEIRGVKGVLLSARNFPSSVALPVR